MGENDRKRKRGKERREREGGKIEAFGDGPWHFHWGSATYTQCKGLWEKKERASEATEEASEDHMSGG